MQSLLERARAITQVVEDSDDPRIDMGALTRRLAAVTRSAVLVIDAAGRILALASNGAALRDDVRLHDEIPPEMRAALSSADAVEANVRRAGVIDLVADGPDRVSTTIPMKLSGRPWGWLVLLRTEGTFDEKDLVLAEYAATILLLAHRAGAAARAGAGAAGPEQVRAAVAALSLSEADAIVHILAELEGDEGTVVASRIADRVGITRSVIVNALRKLESGMAIKSRSLGMKGTYIHVLTPYLAEELERARARR